MKNKTQLDGMPVWFDGKSINEALFCEEFLQTHKIIFTNGAFFTPEGRVTDELPLRGEIFEELKCCAVSNIPRKISNIVELMKLAALVEDFPMFRKIRTYRGRTSNSVLLYVCTQHFTQNRLYRGTLVSHPQRQTKHAFVCCRMASVWQNIGCPG